MQPVLHHHEMDYVIIHLYVKGKNIVCGFHLKRSIVVEALRAGGNFCSRTCGMKIETQQLKPLLLKQKVQVPW